MQFLTFQMYAPMCSTATGKNGFAGDSVSANGDRTGLQEFPTRSQLVGLIGNCLGLAREDLGQLDDLRFAVRIVRAGEQMVDFHTVQSYTAGKRQEYIRTRRDELAEARYQNSRGKRSSPVLSTRGYLTDAGFVVAVWDGDLEKIREALIHPARTPFFGRKSCPFGLPFMPVIEDHPNPAEAARAYQFAGEVANLPGESSMNEAVFLVAEDAATFDVPVTGDVHKQRRHRSPSWSALPSGETTWDRADDLVSVSDAVAELAKLGRKISVRRLQVLCGQDRVPGARKVGRAWLIPRSALSDLAADVRGPGGTAPGGSDGTE